MKIPEPSKAEIMFERGHFTANGYTFTVEPVRLGEEEQYLSDVRFFLYPHDENGRAVEEPTEQELTRFAIALFMKKGAKKKAPSKPGLIPRVKLWLAKHIKKDYRLYADNPEIMGALKWIERKVKYKGKNIRFYDLERKYGLSKAEIINLFGYFEKMSGF